MMVQAQAQGSKWSEPVYEVTVNVSCWKVSQTTTQNNHKETQDNQREMQNNHKGKKMTIKWQKTKQKETQNHHKMAQISQ